MSQSWLDVARVRQPDQRSPDTRRASGNKAIQSIAGQDVLQQLQRVASMLSVDVSSIIESILKPQLDAILLAEQLDGENGNGDGAGNGN